MSLTADELLIRLRARGALRLERVTLRRNRSTLWSLTGGGRRLNLHAAYAGAPDPVLDALALVCTRPRGTDPACREAARTVREWSGVRKAVDRIRTGRLVDPAVRYGRVPGCAASAAQRVHLQRLYRTLNATRFAGVLPATVPIRLSRRFTTRLGHMVPGVVAGERRVLEIVLNADLLLPGNDASRIETMVHEMAHAAAHLFDAHVGHGAPWRRWAERAGCAPSAVCTGRILRRRRRGGRVRRVPPLPAGWRERARGGQGCSSMSAAG